MSWEDKEAPIKGTIKIDSDPAIIRVRRLARKLSKQAGFALTDTTRIVTAVSELARNAWQHARGGSMHWKQVSKGGKRGLELIFEDHGDGIPDINLAMEKGYSTSNGQGLGLPGTKRLMDEFEIQSEKGKGTKVSVRKWLR